MEKCRNLGPTFVVSLRQFCSLNMDAEGLLSNCFQDRVDYSSPERWLCLFEAQANPTSLLSEHTEYIYAECRKGENM